MQGTAVALVVANAMNRTKAPLFPKRTRDGTDDFPPDASKQSFSQ